MPPVLGHGNSLRMWVKGQRWHVTISWLFKILLMGSSSFLRQWWPRAGRPCNLNRTEGPGKGVELVHFLKLTLATCRLHGLWQMAPPLPAFGRPWTHVEDYFIHPPAVLEVCTIIGSVLQMRKLKPWSDFTGSEKLREIRWGSHFTHCLFDNDSCSILLSLFYFTCTKSWDGGNIFPSFIA